MPVVAITHAEAELPRFFAPGELDRLRAVAEIRILGSNQPAAILPRLAEVDYLLGSWGMPKLDAALLAAAPRLKAVCYAAGSVRRFVTDESYARGVLITTAMQVNAVPVAEVCLALITLANKKWFQSVERIRAQGQAGFQGKQDGHVGNYRTVVGLIGFGAIGRLVAEKLRTMELSVLVYDPYAKPEALREQGCEPVTDLIDLARRSDVVSLHAPNIPATRHMLKRDFFAAMRDGATFINTARGALVDESGLIAELETGRISAHLDVTDPEPPVEGSPFYRLPNVWLSPHRAGSSSGEVRRMGTLAVDECLALIAGRPPRFPVSQAMLATMA